MAQPFNEPENSGGARVTQPQSGATSNSGSSGSGGGGGTTNSNQMSTTTTSTSTTTTIAQPPQNTVFICHQILAAVNQLRAQVQAASPTPTTPCCSHSPFCTNTQVFFAQCGTLPKSVNTTSSNSRRSSPRSAPRTPRRKIDGKRRIRLSSTGENEYPEYGDDECAVDSDECDGGVDTWDWEAHERLQKFPGRAPRGKNRPYKKYVWPISVAAVVMVVVAAASVKVFW